MPVGLFPARHAPHKRKGLAPWLSVCLKCGRNGWLAEMQLAVVVAANVIAPRQKWAFDMLHAIGALISRRPSKGLDRRPLCQHGGIAGPAMEVIRYLELHGELNDSRRAGTST
jgi:hypothetical protein